MDSAGTGGIFSCVHFIPPFVPPNGVAGTKFTGEWGNVPTRGYDELGKTKGVRGNG
jgi:hypothetical protein